jgi:alpha-D-ribose 1-methylphosphonate 5-triphosphate synthase subunit PhnG
MNNTDDKMNFQDIAAMDTDRQRWMALLGGASVKDLETEKEKLRPDIDWEFILKPEVGLLMVQSKADGSHPGFNLGEMSVTKCVLQVQGQYLGYAVILGSDLVHAELAALFDGLLQHPDFRDDLKNSLISNLALKQKEKDRALEKETADTRVEFFTLKRGE